MKKRIMKKKFTLIELIIVIVVIGILAGMALPKFMGVQRNAKASGLQNDCDVLQTLSALIETERSQDAAPYGSLTGAGADITTQVNANADMKMALTTNGNQYVATDKIFKLDKSIYETKLSKDLKTAKLENFGIITTGKLEGAIIYLGDKSPLGVPTDKSNGVIDGNNEEWFGVEIHTPDTTKK